MIIADKKQPVITTGLQQESHFNIKDENVAHIFSILRNQLYSDKIGAIIREYVTNAIDAHTEASIEKPIEITLPTIFSKDLIIRDFGKGLSEKDIVEIFASYGASTKRQSNSFTGMLGIGSKSAFSYTNTFTVISRHDGVETTYQAFIDESNIGTIASVHKQPTNESGLSIHIAIKPNEINQLYQSLSRFLMLIDYTPTILGSTFQIYKPKITTSGNSWRFIEEMSHSWRHDRKIYVVMGNVTYTTSYDVMSKQLDNIDLRWLDDTKNSNLVIYAPIGTVKPSASRESLEFNDLTKNYLIQSFIRIKSEFVQSLIDAFEKCDTKYKRHCVAYDLTSSFGNLIPSYIRNWCFHFNKDFLAQKDEPMKIKEISKSFNYLMDKGSINVMPDTIYVVHDNTQRITHIQNRVSEYYNSLSGKMNLVVLKFSTPEYKQRFMTHPSFEGAVFVDAGTLPFQGVTKTSLKSEEASVYEFRRNYNLNIESWKPTTTPPPDNAVYIEISSFKPKNYKENIVINNAINTLRGAFGIIIPTIYGVKTADLKKTVQPTWIELKDYVSEKFNEWKKNNPDKVRDYEYFKDANVFQKELIGDFEPWKHLTENLTSFYRYSENYFGAETSLRALGIDAFKYNPPKEFEELYNRYPFMRAFICSMIYPDKIRLIKYLDMS